MFFLTRHSFPHTLFSHRWRGFPLLYIGVVFFLIPLLLLGISALFTGSGKGNKAFGSIIVIALILVLIRFLWWWFRQDGMAKTRTCFQARQNKREVMNAIPLEWNPLKNEVKRLKVYTGLPDEEPDEDGDDEENDVKGKDIEGNEDDEEEIGDDDGEVEVGDLPSMVTKTQTPVPRSELMSSEVSMEA
jgi:hypothetical protein